MFNYFMIFLQFIYIVTYHLFFIGPNGCKVSINVQTI